MSRTLNLDGGLSFEITEERKTKLDSGIRLRRKQGRYALWNRQAAEGMWVVNAGRGSHVPPVLSNLTLVVHANKLYGLNRTSSRVVAWEGNKPDGEFRSHLAALVLQPRMVRQASENTNHVVKSAGRSIKVARCRIGNEFLFVADDYFHRPASDDFWKFEAADGDNMVISRLVPDTEGSPQVDEVSRRMASASRIPFRSTPTEPDNYSFLALSPADDVLLLDESMNTYRLAEALSKDPHNRFEDPSVEKPLRVLAVTRSQMMKDQMDQRWASEWASFSSFLATHGPIKLDPKDEYFQSFLDLNRVLTRAVRD